MESQSRGPSDDRQQTACIETNQALSITNAAFTAKTHVWNMITATQVRAARALASVDQRKLAELSGLSLPTIQRMESSEDLIRGNVDSFTKLIAALESLGIELIGEGAVSQGEGRGVRLRKPAGARRERTETEEPAESASPSREGR